jgi:hypothetical protein
MNFVLFALFSEFCLCGDPTGVVPKVNRRTTFKIFMFLRTELTPTNDRFAVLVLPSRIVGRYFDFDKLLDGYPEGLTVRVAGISRMVLVSQPVKRRDEQPQTWCFGT